MEGSCLVIFSLNTTTINISMFTIWKQNLSKYQIDQEEFSSTPTEYFISTQNLDVDDKYDLLSIQNNAVKLM